MGKVHLRLSAFFPGLGLTGAFLFGLFSAAAPAAEQAAGRSRQAGRLHERGQAHAYPALRVVPWCRQAERRATVGHGGGRQVGRQGRARSVAGKGAESPLIEAFGAKVPRIACPKPAALAEAEIKLIETWIDQGAKVGSR